MADLKITQLNENTTPATGDLLPIVDDPGGSPETQKIALSSLKASGAEVNTGTDDVKFVTSKAMEDSAYIKAPPTITRSIWIPASSMTIATGAPTLSVADNMGSFWLFDGASNEVVGCPLLLPSDWSAANAVNFYWGKTTTAAGDIQLSLRYTDWMGEGAASPASADHNDEVTATGDTTVNLRIQAMTFTPTGATAGDMMMMGFGRNGASASDTYDGVDIRFFGAQLTYTSTQ